MQRQAGGSCDTPMGRLGRSPARTPTRRAPHGLRLRHWLTTPSVIALAVGISGEAWAQACGTAPGSMGSCTVTGTQTNLAINGGVTISGSITNTGTIGPGAGGNAVYVKSGG